MAVQLMTRTWSFLSKSAGLETFQTSCSPYLVYSKNKDLLHVVVSSTVRFSFRSQLEPLCLVESSVNSDEKVEEAAWERPETPDQATGLLAFQFLSHLHALFAHKSLYTLNGDKLLRWKVVKQLQITAPTFPLVIASILHDVIQPSKSQLSAAKRPRMMKLAGKKSVVSSPATSAEIELWLEIHQPLMYRTEALLLTFGNKFCH